MNPTIPEEDAIRILRGTSFPLLNRDLDNFVRKGEYSEEFEIEIRSYLDRSISSGRVVSIKNDGTEPWERSSFEFQMVWTKHIPYYMVDRFGKLNEFKDKIQGDFSWAMDQAVAEAFIERGGVDIESSLKKVINWECLTPEIEDQVKNYVRLMYKFLGEGGRVGDTFNAPNEMRSLGQKIASVLNLLTLLNRD